MQRIAVIVSSVLAAVASACEPRAPEDQRSRPPTVNAGVALRADADRFAELRRRMVSEQLAGRDIHDARVLAAMGKVPREEFVAPGLRDSAYDDRPLPIEAGQTISQPYIVALMTELADVKPGERVLEVGTGSGYQAAVLAELGAEVYSIEIVDALARSARQRLERLGYEVEVRSGDGYAGWPEHAPFGAIVVTAAPPEVPQPLKDQLAMGGRLVVPVGDADQHLWVFTRTEQGLEQRQVIPVRFVPMTGRAQQRSPQPHLSASE
jgi:protein-L-isoaspartate(D-aspartate) O-methyltransferase